MQTTIIKQAVTYGFLLTVFYLLLCARYNNFGIAKSLKNVFCSFSVIRFEHRTAGFVVKTLPLCYAVCPPPLLCQQLNFG